MIRYQITDGNFRNDPAAWFERLRRDVDFIQVRERDLTARDLVEVVRATMSRTEARVLVNDRIDVAIASGAAGVHLRDGSVSAARVKQLAPLIVTVACHREEDCLKNEGADYLLPAPVFSPISKADTRPPLGLETLRRWASLSPTPLIALGGITPENANACLRAGAAGVAGITMWADQTRPAPLVFG
ncbi:MAG TPA: thiamine phosphate synthase [Bryobacteraceae bacterium]|nr:thiamine phosphate synthase [Bryobacteraceae bacterium]